MYQLQQVEGLYVAQWNLFLVFLLTMSGHNAWGYAPEYRISALIPSNETYLWCLAGVDPPQHPYILLHTPLDHAPGLYGKPPV